MGMSQPVHIIRGVTCTMEGIIYILEEGDIVTAYKLISRIFEGGVGNEQLYRSTKWEASYSLLFYRHS